MFDLVRMGASAGGAYEIGKSLRFNSTDTTTLSRTFSSDGNKKTFTISFWMKTCVKTWSGLCTAGFEGSGASASGAEIYYAGDGTGTLDFRQSDNNSNTWRFTSSTGLLDPTAWYHVVIACDTTQSTASNRVKMWINGVAETASTYTAPSQNLDTRWMKTAWRIGAYDGNGPYGPFDGYFADWYVIDGTAKQATDFGEFDSITGQWIPKEYTGSYGTNGFYLNWGDNSNTTASTLGKDSSGNSNNFTCNNLSVSAGIGNDSFDDTPTNNFCTLNRHDGSVTLTQGNLVTNTSSGFKLSCGTIWLTEGKWYWEVVCDDTGNGFVGLSGQEELINNRGAMYDSNSFNIRTTNGNKYGGDGNDASYGSAISDGDVVMVAVDCDAGKAWIGKAGTWFDSGNPATGANAGKTGITGPVRPSVSLYDNEDYTMNFGANMSFAHTPPTGFKKITQQNLAAVTIKDSSKHFDTKLYTGTGSSQTLSGLEFSPGITLIKKRSANEDWEIQDSLRGATKRLIFNDDVNQSTVAGSISAFTSDGFTVVDAGMTNENNATYASWHWKAGSSAANTSGSINSTVSVNASAGISIVTYTGNGTGGATVGHGLGVAPEAIWIKSTSETQFWIWGHHDAGWTHYHRTSDGASGTGGPTDDNTVFNDTAPTSTVFSLGTKANVNSNTETYVAYCFSSVAGFSKIGKYRGDTTYYPFVYTGFTPKWIYSTIGGHRMDQHLDVPGYNTNTTALLGSYNNLEEAAGGFSMNFYSNGFGFNASTGTNNNSNGATGYYIAFAEAPFQYSNAR